VGRPPDTGQVEAALRAALPPAAKLCVAFSGGRDSTVLLHALAALRAAHGFRLRALHVNHGLQAGAGDWAAHCREVAARLGVDCLVREVTVVQGQGKGLEAAAREARYGALRDVLGTGEWLLTAHHADDQLETVLLHLLRGSGPAGLAGIPALAPFGAGHLCRPLLNLPGTVMAAYASGQLAPAGLAWLDDPMNADLRLDRAFVRHELGAVLRRRFPAAAAGAGRSAALAGEAAGLLDELARGDAEGAVDGARVSVAALARLGDARRRNLVRYLVRTRGWPAPPERRLRTGLDQLMTPAPGRQPVVAWGGREIRRYRDHLHLLDAAVPPGGEPTAPRAWPGGTTLDLGPVRGRLAWREVAGGGLAPQVVAAGLEVTFRRGGERVRPDADRHHRTLKFLFQARGVVPWMRPHVPLVLGGGRLAAVGDLWVADWAAAAPGARGLAIAWTGHSPLE